MLSSKRIFIALIALAIHLSEAAAIIPHSHTPSEGLQEAYIVFVNDIKCEVYGTGSPGGSKAGWVHFSCAPSEELSIRILAEGVKTDNVSVSPLRHGIQPAVNGNEVRFTITGPKYLQVFFQGSADSEPYNRLFLLGDPIDTDAPSPGAENVINPVSEYGIPTDGSRLITSELNEALKRAAETDGKNIVLLPKGLYRSGTVFLQSGVTLYLESGAVLKASDDPRDFPRDLSRGLVGNYRWAGFIVAHEAPGCAVRGPGVIDGNGKVLKNAVGKGLWPDFPQAPHHCGHNSGRLLVLNILYSPNVVFEGVVITNNQTWSTYVYQSGGAIFDKVKIISGFSKIQDDGIDFDSSPKVKLLNSFIATSDDNICFKSLGINSPGYRENTIPVGYSEDEIRNHGPEDEKATKDVFDVLVYNNVVISSRGQGAMKIGRRESRGGKLYNMLFMNNTILEATRGFVSTGTSLFDSIGLIQLRGNCYEHVRKLNFEATWGGVFELVDEVWYDVTETKHHYNSKTGGRGPFKVFNLSVEGTIVQKPEDFMWNSGTELLINEGQPTDLSYVFDDAPVALYQNIPRDTRMSRKSRFGFPPQSKLVLFNLQGRILTPYTTESFPYLFHHGKHAAGMAVLRFGARRAVVNGMIH